MTGSDFTATFRSPIASLLISIGRRQEGPKARISATIGALWVFFIRTLESSEVRNYWREEYMVALPTLEPGSHWVTSGPGNPDKTSRRRLDPLSG